MDLTQVLEKLEELDTKAADLTEKLETAETDEERKALQDNIAELNSNMQELTEERDKARAEKHSAEMGEQIKALKAQLEEMRKPDAPLFGPGVEDDDTNPYTQAKAEGKSLSFFGDLYRVLRNRDASGEAAKRLNTIQDIQGKALTEGTPADGGYLVEPDILSGLLALREHNTPLQAIIPSIDTTSDQVQLTRIATGTAAAFADELAEKTEQDMTFAQFTENVFTAAGLGTVSNQLLADANPAVDQLIVRDIGTRLAILREQTYWSGSGTGEPTGILNTPGTTDHAYTDATPTAAEILLHIAQTIAEVQDAAKVDVSHIAMHPKVWLTLITATESDGHYTLGVGPGSPDRRGTDGLPSRTLFGYPVLLSYHLPTDLGAGTNETAIVVGNFGDALRIERQAPRVDTSEHVYFTSNQTIFRVEERYGFTAARYPEAFGVIEGTGLIVS